MACLSPLPLGLEVGAGHTRADEASAELAEGGRRVVLGVGPAQGETPGLPALHGDCSKGLDQRHERDTGQAGPGP